MVVEDVEVKLLLGGGGLPDVVDGLRDGGLFVDGHHPARHDPARGLVRVLKELLDFLGFRLGQQVDDLLGLLVGQVLDDGDRVVSRHVV